MEYSGILSKVFIIAIAIMVFFASMNNTGYNSENLRRLFIVITVLVIGVTSILKGGIIDIHLIWSTGCVMIPAVVVMSFLGQKIGEILDNPRNKDIRIQHNLRKLVIGGFFDNMFNDKRFYIELTK